MEAYKKQNQLNPPLPKRKRVDKLGNDKRRLWLKAGNSTMLVCKGVTENAAKVISESLRELCEKLGTKLEGNLICTR